MTFEEESLKPRSEKITLVTLEADAIAKVFELHGSGVYKRTVPLFVSEVRSDGVKLTQDASIPTLNNHFFYDHQAGLLYLKTDGANPVSKNISIRHKFFFSTASINLPHDLGSGYDVEWQGRIDSIGNLGQRLDDESTGIVLESDSSVSIINNDNYMGEYFDTLLWENKPAKFHMWFPTTPISEARQVFDGLIESKDFGDTVTFRIKDFVFRLNSDIVCPRFSASDAEGLGSVPESFIEKPKRRIYGKVDGLRCIPLDAIGEGYLIDGTASISQGSNIVTFSDVVFEKMFRGDEFTLYLNNEEYKFSIEEFTGAYTAEINKESSETITDSPVFLIPSYPRREVNRRFNVSGHKCYDILEPITTVVSSNRFMVSNPDNFSQGDTLLINSVKTSVLRVSGNTVVTTSSISPVPNVGDIIFRPSIQKLHYGSRELVFQRDWTYDNEIDNCDVIIDEDAEFNVTEENLAGINFTFTNGSFNVTTASVTDLKTILRAGDWIKKNTITSGEGDWYRILDVREQLIIISVEYAGTTATTSLLYRAVKHISDEDIITVTAYGYDDGTRWIKTAAQAARHLVMNDAGFATVNEASFTQADADCDYTLSLAVPEYEGVIPKIKDVLTKINESVFGSLYGNSSSSVSYSILNSTKPLDYYDLRDDDIISWSADTITEIYNRIIVRYAPFTSKIEGENSLKVTEYNSGFVDNYTQIVNTLDKTVYLYDEEAAQTIAQRLALFKSMPSTKLTIKSKMNLYLAEVNEKVGVSFDKLFKRFSGGDKLRLGIVTGVKRLATESEIVVNDLGGIFNRVPSISEDGANDYSTSTDSERLRWGYVVDNDTLTPNPLTEDNLGSNIIG